MPLLQVRDCPEDLYDRIRDLAKKEHRTISGQVLALLQKAVDQSIDEYAVRKQEILHELLHEDPVEIPMELSPERIIREDRDR